MYLRISTVNHLWMSVIQRAVSEDSRRLTQVHAFDENIRI